MLNVYSWWKAPLLDGPSSLVPETVDATIHLGTSSKISEQYLFRDCSMPLRVARVRISINREPLSGRAFSAVAHGVASMRRALETRGAGRGNAGGGTAPLHVLRQEPPGVARRGLGCVPRVPSVSAARGRRRHPAPATSRRLRGESELPGPQDYPTLRNWGCKLRSGAACPVYNQPPLAVVLIADGGLAERSHE